MKKILLLTHLLLGSFSLFSQWNGNPGENNAIARTSSDENYPMSVSDGLGGSIVFYQKGELIVAKRITADGVLQWTSPEVTLFETTDDVYSYTDYIAAEADGGGGVFVAISFFERDNDFGDILVKHITATGVSDWGPNGAGIMAVAAPLTDDYDISMCLDGAGGIILGWLSDNTVDNIQMRAQKLNATGAAQWGANGVQVITATGFRGGALVAGGSGTAIAVLYDTRNDPNGTDYDYVTGDNEINSDIFAQKLSATGQRLWGDGGVAVCTAPRQQVLFTGHLLADGQGSVVVFYNDARNSSLNDLGYEDNMDIYAQKLDASGAVKWAVNGVPVATADGSQNVGKTIADGLGNSVLFFYNEEANQYALQKLASTGSIAWGQTGIYASTDFSYTQYSLAASSAGSVILAGYGYDEAFNTLIKAQKYNAQGAPQWGTSGVLVCSSKPYNSPVVAASNNGAAIVCWPDYRTYQSTQVDIYASKILDDGTLAGGVLAGEYVSAAAGNWNTPATWVGGVVPPNGAKVTVRHLVTVNVGISCYSLKVEQPSGQIKVNAGIVVNITH